MKRHDDRPASSRFRGRRTAVLALLPLGMSLGCGHELIRPAVAPMAPNAYSMPVASPLEPLGAYGINVAEMIPASYAGAITAGPRPLVGTIIASPGWRPNPASDPLLSACRATRIPPPTIPANPTSDSRSVVDAGPTAPCGGLSLLDAASRSTGIPLPASPRRHPVVDPTAAKVAAPAPAPDQDRLLSACQATRIAPPRVPRPRNPTVPRPKGPANGGVASVTPPVPSRVLPQEGPLEIRDSAAVVEAQPPSPSPIESPQKFDSVLVRTSAEAAPAPPALALPRETPPLETPAPTPDQPREGLDALNLKTACETAKIPPPIPVPAGPAQAGGPSAPGLNAGTGVSP